MKHIDTNTCDKCKTVERTEDLVWISTEDFEPKKGEVVPKSAYKKYDALCEPCYKSILVKTGAQLVVALNKLVKEIEGTINSTQNDILDCPCPIDSEDCKSCQYNEGHIDAFDSVKNDINFILNK